MPSAASLKGDLSSIVLNPEELDRETQPQSDGEEDGDYPNPEVAAELTGAVRPNASFESAVWQSVQNILAKLDNY